MEDQGSSGDQGCQLISAQGRGCGLDGWEKGVYTDFIKKMTKRGGAVPEILQEWEKTQADLKKRTFTKPEQVEKFLKNPDLDDITKNKRLYVEVRHASLSFPKASDVVRLKNER
ncbi:hypothetical protein EMCRGX_G003891 [Ephydatia muelleri]